MNDEIATAHRVAASGVFVVVDGNEVRIEGRDCIQPDWENVGRIHDWRNYVSDGLRDIWPSFSRIQRMVIAANAAGIASGEEWD